MKNKQRPQNEANDDLHIKSIWKDTQKILQEGKETLIRESDKAAEPKTAGRY